MTERPPRRQPRATVDDPYTKPWVARDAAKNVVKQGVASGRTAQEMIDRQEAIVRPDYTAVIGRLVGMNPSRDLAPDAIGVTGFVSQGEIFPLAEVWREVTGEALPPDEPTAGGERWNEDADDEDGQRGEGEVEP